MKKTIPLLPAQGEKSVRLLQDAMQMHRLGDLVGAKTHYRKILKRDKRHPDALHLLGLIAYQEKNYPEAERLIRAALDLNNTMAAYYSNLGLVLHAQQKLSEATEVYRQALKRNPRHAEAHYNLGLVLAASGDSDAANECYCQAIQYKPGYPEAYDSLAALLANQERYAEAETACHQALAGNPHFATAHYSLGNILYKQNKTEVAIESYRRATALNPVFSQAWNNLGVALKKTGRPAEAANAFLHLTKLAPDSAKAWSNLGSTLTELGSYDAAVSACRKAAAIDQQFADAWNNLGNALQFQCALKEAKEAFLKAVSLDRDCAEAISNLAGLLRDTCRHDEALDLYRRAMIVNPDDAVIHGNFLLALHYASNPDPERIFAEHQAFNRQHTANLIPHQNHPNTPDSQRRLRIGYVSGDFRKHSVAYFIEPVLSRHDSDCFEVFCYASQTRNDEVTERLRTYAAHWIECAGLSHSELATRIKQDEIDILVDLVGHTAGSRLLTFARKPAPVQMTYLGYPDTTGLTAMDYRLSDAHADPEDRFSAERVVRMPDSYFCYQAPEDAPEVSELPAEKSGYITFGSFNNYAKLSREILAIWARLLNAVPNARLALKAKSLSEPEIRRTFQEDMQNLGVNSERITLLDYAPSTELHLREYHQVDIALDTYPYNGATTTCEALWMGVPLVTLTGKIHAARAGLSILSALGMDEFVAGTPEEYLNICIRLASDLPRLKTLRSSLRQTMSASPLMDADKFTSTLEGFYREMWTRWCDGVSV